MGEKPDPKSSDLTPLVGAQTDIAPLGRTGQKPPHERTADEDTDVIDWEKLASNPAFRELLRRKKCFVIPATIFFIIYYFALPILVGYAPQFMSKPIIGAVNLAYLFALSQFIVAWILAALYVRVAGKFDRMTEDLLRNYHAERAKR